MPIGRANQSTTDPDARRYKKSTGSEARLAYLGHALMENRHGLLVKTCVTEATGTAEREAALQMIQNEEARMNLRRAFAASLMAAVLTIVVGSSVRGQEKAATLKGYVLDSACAFVKNLKKPVSRECALKCAKAGSPLVVLADDGTIYWPISDSVPATGQNQRLMRFAGHRVTLSGKVFERGGSRAIVIERVEIETTGK